MAYLLQSHVDKQGPLYTEKRRLLHEMDETTVQHGLCYFYVDLTSTKYKGMDTTAPYLDEVLTGRIRFVPDVVGGNIVYHNNDRNYDVYVVIFFQEKRQLELVDPTTNVWSSVKNLDRVTTVPDVAHMSLTQRGTQLN